MSSFKRMWALVAMAAVPWLSMAPAEASAQATGTIRGTVVQVPSGQPMVAVQVSLVGTQRGTISGRDGTFQMENVPAGQAAFLHRARMNGLAAKGEWAKALETA